MRKTWFLVLGLTVAAPSWAQVFKCQEGGRTVITDRPCIGGETMKVRPASGGYDPRAGAEADRRIERQAAQVEEGYRLIEEQRAREAVTPRARAEPDECDRLREEHADAKHWEGEFRHPDNIARERERRKKAASDSFFRCGPGKRVSVFDQ